MIKPIKKPNWGYGYFIPEYTYKIIDCSVDAQEDFNTWWKNEVEPLNDMLAQGVEVYADSFEDNYPIYFKDRAGSGKKALLINIQEIKKESAEDVLRDFLSVYSDKGGYMNKDLDVFRERARRALEDS